MKKNLETNESKARELYKSWAEYYDEYFYPSSQCKFGYDEEFVDALDVWLKSIDAKSILDCASGTGNPSLGLAKKGYDVYCSDISANMLAQLNKKALQQGIPIKQIKTASWTELPMVFPHQRFDVVLCTGNALFHIEDQQEFVKTFRAFHAVLQKGGRLYADYLNVKNNYKYHCQRITYLGSSPYQDKNILKFRIFNQFDEQTQRLSLWFYFLIEENGSLHFCETPFKFEGRPFLINEIYDFALQAGFQQINPIDRWGQFSDFHAICAEK
ncbi:MAG: class I SAM-dependent methyltransferase [Candidatus Aminicenantes bacterium]|jgi:ubiquinone/menaquinone biosynthesis C-methylase UbiE